MSNPLRPWPQPPEDPTNPLFVNWMVSALNQLIGQSQIPPSTGLQSLQNNTVDPATSQIISKGSRASSVTTAITFVAGTTSVAFYWDGTNGSIPLTIGRDDGTTVGPLIQGSPATVTGLTANTLYRFYAYWNEATSQVKFATVAGISVGLPSYAFTAPNFAAAHQQILRGNIPLGILLVTTGITTPNSGTSTGSGGSGGGGAGAGGDRGNLQV